jgi:hypothetical protein
MNIATEVFDLLDKHVEECLQDDAPRNVLFGMYWDWWQALKERVGTSSGFTGLSEYLFFRYILKSIERRTGTTFKAEPYTNDTSIFRSQNFLLTHDMDIAQFVSGVRPQRTDIALLSQSGNGDYRLLAAFELKVYVSDRNIIEDLFKRLGDLGKHTESFLFSIFFSQRPQYANEMCHFCETYPGRAFLISPIEHKYGIDIKKAIDIIPL